jgi:hypothetical protein
MSVLAAVGNILMKSVPAEKTTLSHQAVGLTTLSLSKRVAATVAPHGGTTFAVVSSSKDC